jgi:hypothetical protein
MKENDFIDLGVDAREIVDVKDWQVVHWIHPARDRNLCRLLFALRWNFRVPLNTGNFLVG